MIAGNGPGASGHAANVCMRACLVVTFTYCSMSAIMVSLRVHNRMKRVMRCHDFRSGQGVRRRRYREYHQGAGRSPGRKVVPALRVAAKIAAYVVGRLDRILDTLFGVLL